jgi:hypothetical protein
VVFPGALTLHRAAGDVGVAGRRVQKVHDPNRDLHVGAAVPVYEVRPPAGVQTVGEVANAATVLSRENVKANWTFLELNLAAICPLRSSKSSMIFFPASNWDSSC